MATSLPNLLTISRILVIPLIVATFYIEGSTARWVGCVLFVVAAITDFFDGYFARRSNSVSSLGRFLDPIADKLLVAAVLLMLTAFERLSHFSYLPALVILLREILVSGLREYLAELRIGMPVSRLAKWKTGIQMTALPTLIVGSAAPHWIPAQALGEFFLWGAAALTLVTGWDYLRAGLKHMQDGAP
ncbi:MAG: CDP-diacylglycerol--glycerol-3-phosphate 3-phosphatidyltransferase [Telmatospirillum sp.]|nr:CDP-diacylglycerol--glycerol-3-phosphate 3-phosphatidyltransferase [Telmatospirillum sp.]